MNEGTSGAGSGSTAISRGPGELFLDVSFYRHIAYGKVRAKATPLGRELLLEKH